MRPIKTNVLTGIFNDFFVDSPMPTNISYMWNFGSLLGATLLLQIATGVTLAMHYCPNTDLAFSSVEHIMRDVNSGYIIRYAHANGASMFFILVYLHIARGLYYGSYAKPRVLLWSVGVIILLLLIIIGFLGCNGQKWIFSNNIKPYFITHIYCLSIPIFTTQNSRLFNFLKIHNIDSTSPVVLLSNLANPETKKLAYRGLKLLSGIYLIVNLATFECYVGSAVKGNLYMRFYKHLYSLQGNKPVAKAINKYGLSQFAFLVLETVPQKYKPKNKKDVALLIEREDYYIQKLKPSYNILPLASNSVGWKHSEETIALMRKTYSCERKEKVKLLNKGKTLSKETRELMRNAAFLRKPMSAESRAKCVVNIKPVKITDLDGSNAIKFESIKKASIAISCCEKTIRRALSGNGVLKKKYVVSAL